MESYSKFRNNWLNPYKSEFFPFLSRFFISNPDSHLPFLLLLSLFPARVFTVNQKMEMVRALIDSNPKKIQVAPQELRLLKNALIFEEFVKEIAAVMQVQLIAGPEVIDFLN